MMSTSTPVMFLHSFGLDYRAATLARLADAIAPTLPNHGTRVHQKGLRLADMIDEIAAWVHEPVHVVGSSVGGMLAMHLAIEYPYLVKSLVLACTTARTPRALLIERADQMLVQSESEYISETLERWFTPAALAVPPAKAIAYATEMLKVGNRAALADVWRAVAEHDVTSRLHLIDVPTTCIAGTLDVSAPVAMSEEICDQVRGAVLRTVDGAHMAYLEDPVTFSTIVREHLASQASLRS